MGNAAELFVKQTPAKTRLIVEKLREVVRTAYPEAKESIYHGALGYSPTGHTFDKIVYILPSKEHVTLGFFFGVNLPDPNHLLVGEGKRMRHVKIKTREDASGEALLSLIKSARKDATKSLESKRKERIRSKRS